MKTESKNLTEIVTEAIALMKNEGSEEKVNLAEISRRTGKTRQRLRTIVHKLYCPEADSGSKKGRPSVITSNTEAKDFVDSLLRKGVTNSLVIQERLKGEYNFSCSLSSIKRYVKSLNDLVPTKIVNLNIIFTRFPKKYQMRVRYR